MYNTSNSIDVLSFDEVKFDVKSDLFERIKKTSNKIRSNVFSVIDVFYVKFMTSVKIFTGWHLGDVKFDDCSKLVRWEQKITYRGAQY